MFLDISVYISLIWNKMVFYMEGIPMFVKVYNNDVNKALRALKKKIQDDNLYKTVRENEFYEKPSDRKRRMKAIAIRRERKRQDQCIERDGY